MAWYGKVRRDALRQEPVGLTNSGFIGSNATQCAALIAPYEGYVCTIAHGSSPAVPRTP
jgi:hypothetical protein